MTDFDHQQPTRSRASRMSVLSAAVFSAISLAGFGSAAFAADDTSLTWNGITLYGTFDIGVAYQSHGTPLSQDFYPGLEYMISKNSNKSITSVAPNGLSQSKIGLRGNEPLNDEFAFIFNLEMGFQPNSGNLSDALKSLVHNNGVPLAEQKSAADGSRAGQFFNGQAFAGFSSKSYGTLTIGRQNTLLLDNINRFDPMGGSYAFSLIGYSGATAGMGNTQDTRLDDSVKYTYKYDLFHFGGLYQFGKSDSSPGEAWQANAGFDYAGFSVDGVWGKKKDAVGAGSLSAAQLAAGLPQDSLAATISDTETWTIDASYTNGAWKASGGYEHIDYKNPSLPITSPFSGLGGYYFSVVNNNAFPNTKKLDVSWLGLKYEFTRDFDVTGAWYHYDQNSYGAAKCSDTRAGTCSGNEDVYSVRLDYRFNKRFDVYGGAAWSKVSDGLASGFLHTSTWDPMVGVRYQF